MTVCRKIRVARREMVVDTSECSLEELARQRAQDRRQEQAREWIRQAREGEREHA